MKQYVQRGENPSFPYKIEVWEIEKKDDIPSWMTDRCKITGFTDQNKPILKILKHENGVLDFYGADDVKFLTARSINDLAIYDCETGIIRIMNKVKFNLIYKEK